MGKDSLSVAVDLSPPPFNTPIISPLDGYERARPPNLGSQTPSFEPWISGLSVVPRWMFFSFGPDGRGTVVDQGGGGGEVLHWKLARRHRAG